MRQFAFLAMIGVVSAIRLSQDKPATEEKTLPPISKEEMDTVFEEALKMANGDMGVLDQMTMEDWVAACQTAFPEYDNCEGKVQAAAKKHEEMEKQHGEKPATEEKSLPPISKEEMDTVFEEALKMANGDMKVLDEMTMEDWVAACQTAFPDYDNCEGKVQAAAKKHEEMEKKHGEKPEHDAPFTKEDHEAFKAWFETQEEPQSKEEMFNMVVGFCESQGTYDDCAARVQQVFDHHEQHEKDGEHGEHQPKPEGDKPEGDKPQRK